MTLRPNRSSMPAYLEGEGFTPEKTLKSNRRSFTPLENSKSGDESSKTNRSSLPVTSQGKEFRKSYRAPLPPKIKPSTTEANGPSRPITSPATKPMNKFTFIPEIGESILENEDNLSPVVLRNKTQYPVETTGLSEDIRKQSRLSSSSSSCSSSSLEVQSEDPTSQETNTVTLSTLGNAALALLAFRSSGGSAKSAPTTPHGEWSAGNSAAGPPIATNTTPPKSPSNSAGRHDKADKQSVKQLSISAPPQMTHAPQQPQKSGDGAPAATTPSSSIPLTPTPDEPGSSKSRQKKFHRHFKQVAQEERVLNYYSCALVADILLQGQLYITKNYFAFYSNVFGYVTKLLIPTVSVVKISKEKTARIIPNAVGVVTEDDKHVFGSLLSRDATYRLMTQVWKAAMGPEPVLEDSVGEVGPFLPHIEGYESSPSGSERSIPITSSPLEKLHTKLVCTKEETLITSTKLSQESTLGSTDKKSTYSRPTTLLVMSTVLLVILFLSAAVLLYRISLIQSQFNDNPLLSGSDQVYQEILKWQAQLHTRSTNEVQEFLSSNLDQLAKVRKSLEALSLLLLRNEERSRDSQPNYDATLLRNGNS